MNGTTTNEKSLAACDDQARGNTINGVNCAATHAAEQAGDSADKPFRDIQARFALAGYGLFQLSDETYLVTRWGMCRSLPDLRGAAAFLRQIGGAA